MINGYYTTTDLVEQTTLSKSAIQYRVEKLRLPYRIHKVNGSLKIRYYTDGEVSQILNYKSKAFNPEIIYVTRTTFIYESKLNFLNLNQL